MKFNRSETNRRTFFLIFIFSALFFNIYLQKSPAQPKPTPKKLFADDLWKKDGLPFLYRIENKTISDIWAILNDWNDLDLEKNSWGATGFISLRRQSDGYRGQLISIGGRLLRTEFHAVEGLAGGGYYESWIVLDDEKRIPARLLTEQVPDGFLTDTDSPESADEKPHYRHERVTALGVYYRQTSYNAGDDFYNAPMIIAKNFQILSAPKSNETAETVPAEPNAAKNRTMAFCGQIAVLVLLTLLWILLRRRWRGASRPTEAQKSTPDDFHFPPEELAAMKELAERGAAAKKFGGGSTPNESDGKNFSFPLTLVFCTALLTAGPMEAPVAENEKPAIRLGVEFWESVTDLSADKILPAGQESPEALTAAASTILDRLTRSVPDSLLYAQIQKKQAVSYGEILPTPREVLDETLQKWPESFGQTFSFRGRLETLSVFSTGAAGDVFRLGVRQSDGLAVTILTETIPSHWNVSEQKGIGETVGGVGMLFRAGPAEPILLARRVGRYDEQCAAGRLGADLSLFDRLEIIPIHEAEKTRDPQQKKQRLENFQLTQNDRLPFYELLAAFERAPAERLDRICAEPLSAERTVDLFNRPQTCRLEGFSLTGNVKRVRKIPVFDREIQAVYGLDHYYELYIYTNDSQGYPIVLCAPSVPAGLLEATQRENDFREAVGACGIFYKLWAYKIGAEEPSETAKSWIAVPLIIGGNVRWFPEKKAENHPISSSVRSTLVCFFLFALIAFVYFKTRRKSDSIVFRLPDAEPPDRPFGTE